MRYRLPSIRTILGLTKIQKNIKRKAGVYKATKKLNMYKNSKRNLKRRMGYESEIMKIFRFISRLFFKK